MSVTEHNVNTRMSVISAFVYCSYIKNGAVIKAIYAVLILFY